MSTSPFVRPDGRMPQASRVPLSGAGAASLTSETPSSELRNALGSTSSLSRPRSRYITAPSVTGSVPFRPPSGESRISTNSTLFWPSKSEYELSRGRTNPPQASRGFCAKVVPSSPLKLYGPRRVGSK